ncbi:MAG: hypothetical protein ABGW86_00975 [Candidatus Poseidoniia archaeon]|jgi:hypothetical protein
MASLRTFMLWALMISLSLVMGSASADDEYEFRFDDPVNGEGNVDPDDTIDLNVSIENYLDIQHEFELFITNANDLDSSGLDVWWSSDGQDDISSESTTLPSVEVPDASVREGITVSVRATSTALYGTYDINLKCRDKDNSDPEGTKQLQTLSVSVNEKTGVSLGVAESGTNQGSVDVDSETTYLIQVNNVGNKEDTISLSYSLNDWDADFNTNSITIQPFSSQNVILTIGTDSNVEYGDNDDITIMGTSGNSGDKKDTLDLTTYVRVLYGLDLTATTVTKTGEPGEKIIFNFQIMNKWSDNVDFEITKKEWYRGSIDNPPQGWTSIDGTGLLDAFEETTTSSTESLSVTISSSADAGEVITIIVIAKVTTCPAILLDTCAIQTEIEVRVEGNYNIKLKLPQSDQINLDAGISVSTSKYVEVINHAKVSDYITVTATWEIGGNDWTLDIPEPFVVDAGGSSIEKGTPVFIKVKAPESAIDNTAILKIRVTSGGDNTKYDEASITFSVNSAASTSGPETEKLDEEGGLPIDPIWLVSIVLIIGLGSAAVFGLQQRSKGAFGGSEENTDDFSDEWAGMEGATGAPQPIAPPQPVAPPPAQQAPLQPVAPPPAQTPQPVAPPPAEAPPSMAAIPQPVAPPPVQAPPQPVAPPPVAPTILTVTVPAGVVAGQQIQIKAPTGQLVNVKVPEGCGPGSQFKIQI